MVFRKFLVRQNDVTPSNFMEMKLTSANKSKCRHASQCSDLLQNVLLQFSIAFKGILR